ncbi:hypothetical protein HDU96_000943 [Phlyctochytrium bullatum]|nr:hypothetical protein HDU96_000943 [Phlyctochytrium bullatum]
MAATLESTVDDVLNNNASNSKWVLLGRDGESQLLEVVAKGENLSDLRSKVKTAKGACIGVISQSGSAISFRYGTKSKELIASHEAKALLKLHSPSVNVANVDTDLSDDVVIRQSRLPNLPAKIEAELNRGSSTESIASLTAEEKEEELRQLQKKTEELTLSAQRKNEEALRYKKFNETVENQRKEEQAKAQKEQAEIQGLVDQLKKSQPDVAFEGWISFQKDNSTAWHRRWIRVEKPGNVVIRVEPNAQPTAQYNVRGARVWDGESDTGMRNSIGVSTQQQVTIYLLGDNRNEYKELHAAISHLV